MKKLYKLIFGYTCLAYFLLSVVLEASAAPPTVEITSKPEWVSSPVHKYTKPSARTVNNGFRYSLTEEQIHVEKKAVFNRVIRDILSEAGVQNGANISLSFDPTYEKVEFHQLTIWRNNKQINRLNKGVFKIVANEEELGSFLYHGKYTVLLVLDDIRKGDRIEYSYTITGSNPIFKNKFSRELYLQIYEPVAHCYVSLIASKSRPLNIKTFSSATNPKVSDAGALKKYEWEMFDVPAGLYEEYQPLWFNNLARVQVSEYKNWSEVIKWALEVNEIPAGLKGKLLQRVEQLKKKAGNQKLTFFREAVKVVQDEVRYMGIELGESSHRASAPEIVYDRRYGDCKDKSLLLASMLQAAGIPARLALIHTRYEDEIFHHLPSPLAFNHMVVVARMGNEEVWVDPTLSNQGGEGTDIYFPNYKAGLILEKGYNRLVNTPSPINGRTVCFEKYVAKDESSPVELTVETTYTNQQADLIRAQLANNSVDRVSSGNLDYYSKIYPEIKVQDSLKIEDNRTLNRLIIRERYFISNFFQKDSVSKRYNVGFYANFISEQLPLIASNRKHPIALNYPFDIDYTIEILLNSGWNLAPEKFSIERDSYRFSRSVQPSGNALFLNYQFTYNKGYVTPEYTGEFARDIKELADRQLFYSISYQPGLKSEEIKTNYPMVCLAIIVLVGLFFLGKRLYLMKTSPSEDYLEGYGLQLGGVLILVLIGLSLTPFRIFFFLMSQDYFTLHLWETIPPGGNTFLFKSIILFELIFNLFTFCFSLFCVYLFLKRRDILPKYLIGFYVINACGVFLDAILSSYILADNSDIWQEVAKSIVPAVIWIPYFMRSSRVRETFIVPYPAVRQDTEELYEQVE